MSRSTAPPAEIAWIQALRALAAVSVATYHSFQWLDDLFWVGAAGVDVFFVISGFIIWTVGERHEGAPGVFLWRRVTRVAPAYWLMTAVVALSVTVWAPFLPQVTLTPRHVILSLAFIQHSDPGGLPFPVLPPGWSLNYEAVFYLLFTGVLFAPKDARANLILLALAGVAAFGFIDHQAYGLGANPMMLQFAAGVLLARIHRDLKRMGPAMGAGLVVAGVVLLAAMGLAGVRSDLWRPLLWGAPAVMIVAGALALEPHRRLAPPRALAKLGDASYAVYLCHVPTVALVAHTVGVRPAWLFVPIAVSASVAAGLAFHRWVEQPLIGAARRLPHWFRSLHPLSPAKAGAQAFYARPEPSDKTPGSPPSRGRAEGEAVSGEGHGRPA